MCADGPGAGSGAGTKSAWGLSETKPTGERAQAAGNRTALQRTSAQVAGRRQRDAPGAGAGAGSGAGPAEVQWGWVPERESESVSMKHDGH